MSDPGRPAGFADLTVREFVARLASADPTPGGGAASAVAASLGGALVAMVAGLSVNRPRYADHAALHAWGTAEGERLATRLLELADEDADSYGVLAEAMKLPRQTDEERDARRTAMRAAARAATTAPLNAVIAARDVVRAAEALAGRSNANAASDLNVAALLGLAAARGAAENVLVNLPFTGDEAFATAARNQTAALLAETERLAQEVHRVVDAGEARPPRPAPRNELA
jgi:formiminotetrahydrofolate cyclodeaminase